MPTRKELFLNIRQLLIDNITSISGRVYPAYPIDSPDKPFIVLKTSSKEYPQYSVSNLPIENVLSFEIYIYTKSMEEMDTLIEEVENLLHSSDILGCNKEISTDEIIDNIDETSVEHEGLINLTLTW